METSDDLCQLTNMRLDFGTLTLAGGQLVEYINMSLGYRHQGGNHTAPSLTLSPDQARTLAQGLLAAADKAQATGRTGPAH